MYDKVIFLEPYAKAPLSNNVGTPDTWPVAPTDPPALIPGIAGDGSLYPVEKIEAHVKRLHHLAVSVFIVSGDTLLIQRRAKEKYHCGGLWANTCCTHPHYGEDPATTATRRLKDELGFTVPLQSQRVVEYSADVGGGLWERERVHLFRADVRPDDIPLHLNPNEVAEAKWVQREHLLEDVKDAPHKYTPWFRIYLSHYPDLNFESPL